MGMKTYENLKEMLCEELETYAKKGELSAGSLEVIHKLTDTIKNIDKIEMLEEDGGYSRDGGDWEARGSYRDGSSYRGGSSYAGRRRDSMGRYSRDGGMSMRRGGYSRDDGKDEIIEHMRDLMGMAESEEEKQAIRRCISQLENA